MQNLSQRFRVWFCDIWGVVHNGQEVFDAATDALSKHRAGGGSVVLVTNSPRTSSGVIKQIDDLGVPRDCWDGVVTSGDVTRALILEHGGSKLFHIGPGRDFSLFDGLDIAFVTLPECKAVICTGLFHEETETAADYDAMLAEMKQRGLALICANPDKVVRKGNRLLPCAGAIAERFDLMGGRVLMAGKPFAPIYDLAMKCAGFPGKEDVLAIGDGLETDIKGAADFGLAAVMITEGINRAGEDAVAAARHLVPELDLVAHMRQLSWI